MPDDVKSLSEMRKTIDGLGHAFEEFKREHTDALKEIREKGHADPLLTDKVDRIDGAITELQTAKDAADRAMAAAADQVRELEQRLESAGTGGDNQLERQKAEYLQRFDDYLRSCREGTQGDASIAADLLKREKENREVTGTVPASGGYAVPEEIGRIVRAQAKKYSPVRQLVRVVTIGTSDYKELLDINGESSGWVGETGTRNVTDTPTLRERAPTLGTVYCKPQATEEILDDAFINIPMWLGEKCGREIARTEGIAVILGDGTNKPTGFLNGTPVATGDEDSPLRSAEVVEYVPSDPTASPAPTTITDSDALLTLVYKVNSFYRANAAFAMNSLTTGAVRKLKDANDNYLWAPGLQPGEPASLLGFRHVTLEDMPDIAADALPIAFGDWEAFYLMVDRAGLRLSVDNNLTTPGYIKWYMRRRTGGVIYDNNAVKVLKIAAS